MNNALYKPYILENNPTVTLNSGFFLELYTGNHDFDNFIPFPQRIPQNTFFNEMKSVADVKYSDKFDSVVNSFINKIDEIIINEQYGKVKYLINLLNTILRYGVVYNFDSLLLWENKISKDNFYELQLIRLTWQINQSLSQKSKFNLQELSSITKQVLSDCEVSAKIKILFGNRMLVSSYRFSKEDKDKETVQSIYNHLISLTNSYANDFVGDLYRSIMYRGLPMVEEISFKEKEQMLLESVTIANNIVPSNKLEQIILKENKVTLFQTMHKWYLNKKDFHNAEEYIQKIITLDPFDSNPYRVYGFFLMDLEKYAEAANYFELAHHKGPPMVAMNLYYYAKCLELVGKFDISDIVGLLCDVSKFDTYALSPWLDLFNIYVEQKDTIKATAISKHIMKTKDLYEQLTQDEYEQFKGCSNE